MSKFWRYPLRNFFINFENLSIHGEYFGKLPD